MAALMVYMLSDYVRHPDQARLVRALLVALGIGIAFVLSGMLAKLPDLPS